MLAGIGIAGPLPFVTFVKASTGNQGSTNGSGLSHSRSIGMPTGADNRERRHEHEQRPQAELEAAAG